MEEFERVAKVIRVWAAPAALTVAEFSFRVGEAFKRDGSN
jgi:hypothetical protein